MEAIQCKEASRVWAKGDKCLSPYSQDAKLYPGQIEKLTRSPAGKVLAWIKFDGYEEDECEEVVVSQLQLMEGQNTTRNTDKGCQGRQSPMAGSMFSPLQGSELGRQLKEKYEHTVEDGEDKQLLVKTEKLSAILFEDKNKQDKTKSGNGRSERSPAGSRSRKDVVAIGGESVSKDTRKKKVGSLVTLPDDESPTKSRIKHKLEITGGQAIDSCKELRTSKKISDISSVLDTHSVNNALDVDSNRRKESSPAHRQESRSGPSTEKHARNVLYDDAMFDHSFTGFDEADMEKPKLAFKADGAKVPLILSQADVSPTVQVCANINQYLRDYQREGIKFLYAHYKANRGAILGDDMGLGKTIQVIGFLCALLGKQGTRADIIRMKPSFIRQLSDTAITEAPSKGPFLIIGPGCVLFNWLQELEIWGHFSVRKYHGSDKAECLKDLRKGKVEIVVTTFETYRDHEEILNTVDWDAVIVDEVHKIKDVKAQATQALRKMHTDRRFGLTGTALQNNLLEFWSIMDWAQPDCLGALADFDTEYVKPIATAQRHDANKRELAFGRKQQEKLSEIRKSLMIRRMKSLIKDQLPKKDESVVFCRLSQLQASIYETILNHEYMQYVLNMNDSCDCDSGTAQSKCCYKKTPDGNSIKALMFMLMHLLLKTSNHVALLIPSNKTSHQQARASRKVCKAALQAHPEFVAQTQEASFKTLSDPKYCGKMKVLQGLLKVFSKDHSKVLVFSYSTQVLNIIEQYLMSTGYEYRRIDGTVSAKKRMLVVREFNTDPNIFICLISTKAGGLGLNLTGANRVVIFDPNWNPTHDLQAQDRAYRIGQQRNVEVYRLITAGTIEENMYLRQIYKQQLLNVTLEDTNARRYFYAVQGDKHQRGELFGIKNMFTMRTGNACITHDILKRTERVESGLAGFEVAQYIPAVVRVHEDEECEDVVTDPPTHHTATDAPHITDTSQDWISEFFGEDADADMFDNEAEVDSGKMDTAASTNHTANKKCENRARESHTMSDDDDDDDDDTNVARKNQSASVDTKHTVFKKPANGGETGSKIRLSESIRSSKVRPCENRGGKVRPCESRTGKGLERRHPARVEPERSFQVDQTLAGSYSDVSDVFDECGVVHIHENRKVVGASRAEDHMTRCAISDVYVHHKNSQELAVECEPMSESSEEDEPVTRASSRCHIDDHNCVRSTIVSNVKALIGQTPRAFRLKHMEHLRKFHKCESLLEFAELVLGSSVTDRMKLLASYYGNRDPILADTLHAQVFSLPRATDTSNRGNGRSARVKNLVNTGTGRGKQDRRYKKKVPHRSPVKRSRRQPAQTISFLDDVEPDSESVSLENTRADDPHGVSRDLSDAGVDQIEIGRKVTPRKRALPNSRRPSPVKRSPVKRCKLKDTVAKRDWISPTCGNNSGSDAGDSEDGLNNSNSMSDGLETAPVLGGKKQQVTREDSDINQSQLLAEIGNQSIACDEVMEGNSDCGSGSNVKRKCYTTADEAANNKASGLSILDDVFGDVNEESMKKKKPPPSKHKAGFKQNVAQNGRRVGDGSGVGGVTKQSSVMDDIFGASHTNSPGSLDSEEPAVHLDTSTLQDNNIHCCDNPRLWKKRKHKAWDKRNIVDRLIADSDADFDELFTSGKLKRKDRNTSNNNDLKTDSPGQNRVDGSLSLFD